MNHELVRRLLCSNLTVSVAESLTGGALSSAIVDVPGASAVFRGGIIAYTKTAKHQLLGVSQSMLAQQGAVAADVAVAMAQGVRERFGTSIGLATTGVAGPGPDEGKPAGTVYVGLSQASVTDCLELSLQGNRQQVRQETVVRALAFLLATLAPDE